MSLLTFVSRHDVSCQLHRIFPTYARNQGARRLVEPRNPDRGIRRTIGTAFDYAFRFELERRLGCADRSHWVAEDLPSREDRARLPASVRRTLWRVEVANAAARDFKQRYVREPAPERSTKLELAAHVFRLARFDAIYRAGRFNKLFVPPRHSDLAEIIDMLDLVPWHLFKKRGTRLNPHFDRFSHAVGGADADVISAGRLLELKVKAEPIIERVDVRQILGYLLLARAARRSGVPFPLVRSIGIYLARHGHLWTVPVSDLTSNGHFQEVESWFIQNVPKPSRLRE